SAAGSVMMPIILRACVLVLIFAANLFAQTAPSSAQVPAPQSPSGQTSGQTAPPSQAPAAAPQQPEFVRQGQQLLREGKMDDAIALYRKTLESSPDSVPANNAMGIALDLKGQGADARKYFAKAIEVSPTEQ